MQSSTDIPKAGAEPIVLYRYQYGILCASGCYIPLVILGIAGDVKHHVFPSLASVLRVGAAKHHRV